MLSNFIQIIKVLVYPIIFNISQLFIILLFILLNPKVDINDSNALFDYINKNSLFILLIQCIIFIPFFFIKYKKNDIEENKVLVHDVIKISVFSIFLSIALNFIILLIKNVLDVKVASSLITFTVILGTGVLGPIIEELLFRGIIYEKFKILFKGNVARLLAVLVFSLFHTGGIFQILFAFIIGYYLTYIYDKYQNIYLSIIAHMFVNISSILVSPLLLMLF